MPHHLFLCWKHDGGPSNDHGNGATFLGRYGVEDRLASIGHVQETPKAEGKCRIADLRLGNVKPKAQVPKLPDQEQSNLIFFLNH